MDLLVDKFPGAAGKSHPAGLLMYIHGSEQIKTSLEFDQLSVPLFSCAIAQKMWSDGPGSVGCPRRGQCLVSPALSAMHTSLGVEYCNAESSVHSAARKDSRVDVCGGRCSAARRILMISLPVNMA